MKAQHLQDNWKAFTSALVERFTDQLERRKDCYKAPYETPYEMLQAYGKPTVDKDGNAISYQAPIHHLRRFGCFVSRLIPAVQRRDKFSPCSMLGCMMVGYVHDSTTIWKVWDPEFNVVRTQSDVIFDEERNAHISCLEPEEADPLGLPQEEAHVEVLDTEHGRPNGGSGGHGNQSSSPRGP